MEGLRTCPPIAINQQNPGDFPAGPVGDQDLARFAIAFSIPDDNDSYFVVHTRDADGHREVPLLLAASLERLSAFRLDFGGHLFRLQLGTFPTNLAVEFQVAYVASRSPETVLLLVNVVEALRVGEVAVECEIAGDFPLACPVDQLAEELCVVEKLLARMLALLTLPEPPKLQRIVFPACADIVGDQVVVCQLVSLLGVVPKPTDVFDEFARVVDQYIVDGDHATVRVSRARILLEPLEPLLVQFLLVPLDLREKPVQARLIGGHGKLAVDAAHRLSRGNHQAREVLGQVASLGLAGEKVAELLDGRRNDVRKRSDPWHDSHHP